jgi:Sec-independent protein translocase protein TatA
MRMGTFLLGGIVGALAVTYINRNNGMLMANLANAGQSVGNMVTKAKSKLSNMNMDMDMSNNDHKRDNRSDKSNQHAEFSRVKEILNKDPELKSKVDEILADNQQTTSSTRVQ